MSDGVIAGRFTRRDTGPDATAPTSAIARVKRLRVLPATCALLLGLSVSAPGLAQQAMTAEELEQFIEEQKEALEQVRENQQLTEEKAAEVAAEQARQDARREAAEAEIKTLCEEQEALKAGSFDDCMAEIGS